MGTISPASGARWRDRRGRAEQPERGVGTAAAARQPVHAEAHNAADDADAEGFEGADARDWPCIGADSAGMGKRDGDAQ